MRQSFPRPSGRTQASSVIPVVRSSEAESGTVTNAFVPLNESALPNLPALAPAQVAFVSVPLLPLPDWSAAVGAGARVEPVGGHETRRRAGVRDRHRARRADVVDVAARSRATAVSVCEPLATAVVSQRDRVRRRAVLERRGSAPSSLNCTPDDGVVVAPRSP